jgi:hypothetical protein
MTREPGAAEAFAFGKPDVCCCGLPILLHAAAISSTALRTSTILPIFRNFTCEFLLEKWNQEGKPSRCLPLARLPYYTNYSRFTEDSWDERKHEQKLCQISYIICLLALLSFILKCMNIWG